MGRNRGQYTNLAPSKILNRADFDIKDEQLYPLWQEYYSLRSDGVLAKEATDIVIKKYGISLSQICYLLALGFELMTAEYFRIGRVQ